MNPYNVKPYYEKKAELLKRFESIEYIRIPNSWGSRDTLIFLKVDSCRHFKSIGIRKGGYIAIDTSAQYVKGEPCAFVKQSKGKTKFRLSRKALDGYEFIGRLAIVVSFPMLDAELTQETNAQKSV